MAKCSVCKEKIEVWDKEEWPPVCDKCARRIDDRVEEIILEKKEKMIKEKVPVLF